MHVVPFATLVRLDNQIRIGEIVNEKWGSSALNPGAVFLRFFTAAFLLFLTPAGGSNPAGQSLTFN